jgi:hypothetical protein
MYGITDQWQIGLAIPVVSAFFKRSPEDDISGLKETYRETGLGNVSYLTGYSFSWMEGSLTLALDGEISVPTDTRHIPFNHGKGSLGFSATLERWWERIGLLGEFAVDYALETPLGDTNCTFDFTTGPGVQWNDLFLTYLCLTYEYSTTARFFPNFQQRDTDILRIEFSSEYVGARNTSLEFSIGHDLSGTAHAFFFALGVNYHFRL